MDSKVKELIYKTGIEINHFYDDVWELQIPLPLSIDSEENILFSEDTKYLSKSNDEYYYQAVQGNSEEALLLKALEIIISNYIQLTNGSNKKIKLEMEADKYNMSVKEYEKWRQQEWEN
jgi:hypothetical protein